MKDVISEMRFALDVNGQIVDIDSVTPENKQPRYICSGCGQDMVAALGHVRKHYFRHKGNACSKETYLHKTAKAIIKQKFDSDEKFFIPYAEEVVCPRKEECRVFFNKQLNACQIISEPIDLKEFFDKCELEKRCDDYIADVLISSTKNDNKVLIEIAVTHKCDENKISSGLEILEIEVKDETDLLKLFSFSLNRYPKDKITFYNYNNHSHFSGGFDLKRLSLKPSNNGLYEIGHSIIRCFDLEKNNKLQKDEIIAIIIDSNDCRDNETFKNLIEALLQLGAMHSKVKYCKYCKYFALSMVRFNQFSCWCRYNRESLKNLVACTNYQKKNLRTPEAILRLKNKYILIT